MKRYLAAIPVWCLIVIASLLITAIWSGYALWADNPGHIVAGWSWDYSRRTWTGYTSDGSLVEYTPDWGYFVRVVEPPTVSGLIAAWWPAAASTGVGLVTVVFTLLPTCGPLLRKRIRIPRPRMTLFRMMVVIGTVSAWLWLGRFDPYTRTAGTLIFALMLHAGFRRSFLAKETKAEAAAATRLSRAGIAGYSLVLLLALAWVVTILVWDSYQERPL